MRLARLTIGGLLVGLALFVIIGEHLAGASADAVINARLTTARAPIAGLLTFDAPVLGARVRAGQTLGFIDDDLANNSRLSDLADERAKAEAERARLEDTLGAVREAIDKLEERANLYRSQRLEQMKAEFTASKAAEEAWQAQIHLYQHMLNRATRLTTTGAERMSELEQAESRLQVAERELERAQAQTAAVQVSLKAAERGVFLGDGYNDAPYSEQRISELRWQESELTTALTAQIAILAAQRERLNAERLRFTRTSHATLSANVNGILWTLMTTGGERIGQGQDLFQLVDCDSTMVTLSVTESTYNTLQHGQTARFRPTGETRVFDATIIRLAGPGAEGVYRNLAVAASPRHLERFDVTLSVPGLLGDDKLRCAIGRTGRAFFEARPLDWLRRLWR